MPTHITATELADAAEGLLTSERTGEVEAHLTTCATCAEAASGIASVARILADEPQDHMPAEVASRLSALVAAESR